MPIAQIEDLRICCHFALADICLPLRAFPVYSCLRWKSLGVAFETELRSTLVVLDDLHGQNKVEYIILLFKFLFIMKIHTYLPHS